MYIHKKTNRQFYHFKCSFWFSLLMIFSASQANALITLEEFEARQASHQQDTKDNPGASSMPILAALDISNQAVMDNLILDYETSAKADFSLTKLIRILYLTDTYDSQITAAIANAAIPFTLQDGEER